MIIMNRIDVVVGVSDHQSVLGIGGVGQLRGITLGNFCGVALRGCP